MVYFILIIVLALCNGHIKLTKALKKTRGSYSIFCCGEKSQMHIQNLVSG
jgi:hypothetical protein